MREKDIKYLACPACKGNLSISEIKKKTGGSIETGALRCSQCKRTYKITRNIPRFVSSENYAAGFGLEWTIHARTQYDSYSGKPISKKRFFEETRWPRRLDGDLILEAGSGSGRFTEQAASTGAMVISVDISNAVDANYASNGTRDNVLIVQADIYNMPLRENVFDRVFCFGVLQHTPKAEEAFMALASCLKPGGNLVIDIYARYPGFFGVIKKMVTTKYWVRPFTKSIPPERLYRWSRRYVEFMWPSARFINKIPYFGRRLNLKLLIADYIGMFGLSDEMLKEWAILDTFDMLSAKYDKQYSIDAVKKWFVKFGMRDIHVDYGYNGIEGRGTRA